MLTKIRARSQARVLLPGLILTLLLLLPASLAAAPTWQSSDPAVNAQRLFNEAKALRNAGDLEEALARFEEALHLFEDANDKRNQGLTWLAIGTVRYELADYFGALDAFELVLADRREANDRRAIATILNNIGATYDQLGLYDDAVDVYIEALSLIELFPDGAGEDDTLNNLAGVYVKLGRYDEALDLYVDVILIRSEIFDFAGLGATFSDIGALHDSRGDYAAAQTAYETALDYLTEAGEERRQGVLLNNIGLLYDKQGKYEDALHAFENAMSIHTRFSDRDGAADTLNNIGLTYNHLGWFDRALTAFEEVLTFRLSVGDLSGQAITENNLGLVLYNLGRYQEAEKQILAALPVLQEIGRLDAQSRALNNLGAIYHRWDRYEDALRMYQNAITILNMLDDRAGLAKAQSNVAGVFASLGRYGSALERYKEAQSITEEIGAQVDDSVIRNNIGRLLTSLEQYDEAIDYHQQAYKIQTEQQARTEQASTLNNIGLIYHARSQFEDALETHKAALDIRKSISDTAGASVSLSNIATTYYSLGEIETAATTFSLALDALRAIDDQIGQSFVLANLAALHESQNRIDLAIEDLKRSIALIENIQRGIHIDNLKSSFANGQVDVYNRLIQLLWDEEQYEDAYDYVQRARARAFLEQLGNEQIDFRQGTNADLIAQEQHLQQTILGILLSLTEERKKPTPEQNTTQISNWSEQLRQARRNYEELLIRLKVAEPAYESLVNVSPANLEEIQKKILAEDVTLLEYYVLDEYVLAWVIDREHFQPIKVAIDTEDLIRKANFIRDLVIAKEEIQISSILYDALLKPLLNHAQHRELLIVPHHVLHYLPFNALWDKENQEYLLEKGYSIRYGPSISAFRYIASAQSTPMESLLALGNPDASLFLAIDEVSTIAKLFGTTPHLGKESTERRFREDAGFSDIIHVAAHGIYDTINPLFTRIELSRDPAGSTEGNSGEHSRYDGNLEVHEVYDLRLEGTKLVTLAACQTAMSRESKGDEVIGLPRAFLYAGTPSVITTLWSVESESTAFLMKQFYEYIRQGIKSGEALYRAQQDTMKRFPEPYHWAAFVLHGNDG